MRKSTKFWLTDLTERVADLEGKAADAAPPKPTEVTLSWLSDVWKSTGTVKRDPEDTIKYLNQTISVLRADTDRMQEVLSAIPKQTVIAAMRKTERDKRKDEEAREYMKLTGLWD